MLSYKPSVIAFDVIKGGDNRMIGYSFYGEHYQESVRIFEIGINGIHLSDPTHIITDENEWLVRLQDVIEDYDYIIGPCIHIAISCLQKYDEIYQELKRKARCISSIFGKLNNMKDSRGIVKRANLREIVTYLGVDILALGYTYPNGLYTVKVCYEYFKSSDNVFNNLDFGRSKCEKTKCTGCGYEFADVNIHKKRCKL